MEKQFTPDPLYGSIEIPSWFLEIENLPSIRRMMFIRQLGLKAYIDFPCAIHTRYSHSLGVMELSKRLVKLLEEKQKRRGWENTEENLNSNLNNLMAAGVLHDIGHGPFSHVMDYPFYKITDKTHEDVSVELIEREMKCLEDHGITLNSVINIIKGTHNHSFIHQIINGPLDADKLDYLLRDSYHVGLKYSFDVNYFVNNYVILGQDDNLKSCILGLEDIDKSITTYEVFVVIWKSMYDLVYFSDSTRVAESMLEKSILLAIEKDPDFSNFFTDIEIYGKINDEDLLKKLESYNGKIEKLINNIKEKKLYEMGIKNRFTIDNYDIGEDFLNQITNLKKEEISKLSDELSIELCEVIGVDKYEIICDIIKSRTPKDVYINRYSPEGEPYPIKTFSDIIPAIKPNINIQIYFDSSLSGKFDPKYLNDKFNDMVGGWSA